MHALPHLVSWWGLGRGGGVLHTPSVHASEGYCTLPSNVLRLILSRTHSHLIQRTLRSLN